VAPKEKYDDDGTYDVKFEDGHIERGVMHSIALEEGHRI